MSAEARLREGICRVAASMFARGLTAGSSGNISARLDDGRLLVTPTGSSFGDLDPARLSLFDADGRLVAGDRPTKEMPLHSAFYETRGARTGAVVHLHSTHSVAVSLLPEIDPDSVFRPLTAYSVMRLGKVKLLGLGTTVLSNLDLHVKAEPSVEAFKRITGEIVHLAVFDGTNSTVIGRAEENGVRTGNIFVLKTSPAHACSTGKAALAFQPAAVIERYLAMGLRKVAPRTITDVGAFREDLRLSRERGYAIDDEEAEPGLRCVGAPIRSASGRVFAVISVSGPKKRLDDARLLEYADLVMHYAGAILSELGHT